MQSCDDIPIKPTTTKEALLIKAIRRGEINIDGGETP